MSLVGQCCKITGPLQYLGLKNKSCVLGDRQHVFVLYVFKNLSEEKNQNNNQVGQYDSSSPILKQFMVFNVTYLGSIGQETNNVH